MSEALEAAGQPIVDLTEERNALKASAEKIRKELVENQRLLDELINDALQDAPTCWDGDGWAGVYVIGYIRRLEAAARFLAPARSLAGHKTSCDGACA